jgi:uncharacterized Rmd1/YagE family protein
MDSTRLDAYLVAMELDICTVATYFDIPCAKDRSLVLQMELREVLKTSVDEKMAVLYPFGVIVLVNFDNIEVRHFLHFLDSIGIVVDDTLFLEYADNYLLSMIEDPEQQITLSVDEAQVPDDLAGYTLCVSDVLARSLLLERLDDRVETLSDKGDELIRIASTGKLFYVQFYLGDLADFYKFQVDFAFSSDERVWKASKVDSAKHGFRTKLEELYDIGGRMRTLSHKSSDLEAIISSFTEHSYRRQELRVYSIQAILILSFLFLDFFYYFR